MRSHKKDRSNLARAPRMDRSGKLDGDPARFRDDWVQGTAVATEEQVQDT